MADLFHLAQVNVALPEDTSDDGALSSFFALSDQVNEAADSSPGFVWRPRSPVETPGLLDTDGLLFTISLWRTVDDLRSFVLHGVHAEALKRRGEWFRRLPNAHMALWWLPADHLPNLADAEKRLIHIRQYGPTPYAFDLGRTFPPPAPHTEHCASWT